MLSAEDFSQEPVALLRNLQRVTAPNPGLMTGPGTNSYLVGEPSSGFIVIDPGPADSGHQQRLWRSAAYPNGDGGNIQFIVCTHSHPDHASGALMLQALCVQPPPILGLPSATNARAASYFVPDSELGDGRKLALQVPAFNGAPPNEHSLEALHTPGHAANHLCLVLVQDGVLFTGDHVLQGSTTVIDPPDGNMTDYLGSLDRLLQTIVQHQVQYLLPGHGHPIGGTVEKAVQAVSGLKKHRLQREAKVASAMRQHPGADLDHWLTLVYDDVPQHLWPVARRSLLAHVQRLQALERDARR
jgi:recombination protein RecT